MPFLKEVGVPMKVERLLSCRVTKRCCTMLYQVKYLYRQKKNQEIKEIAETLETNEEVVLKKMNSLTSYYGQLRQTNAAWNSKSGNGAQNIKNRLGLTMSICVS